MLMETLACAPPSYLDATGAGNHREKLSLPLFARLVTTFDRSIRPVDRIDSDVVEVDASRNDRWCSQGKRSRSRNGCSWETWRATFAMESRKFGKPSPGYIRVIYSGRARCVSNVRIIFTRVEILMQFFFLWMQRYLCALLVVKKMAHMLTSLLIYFGAFANGAFVKGNDFYAWKACTYTAFCRGHKIMTQKEAKD